MKKKLLLLAFYNWLSSIVKSPSLNSFGIFAGGNLIVAFVCGVSGLIQARWLDPETFGEFRKYGIFVMYFSLAYSVVHDGLIRQYPYLIGKGEHAAALRIAGVAKWWYCFVTVLCVMFFALLSGFAICRKDYRSAIGWFSQVVAASSMMYGAYLGVMYRTSSEFKRLTYNSLISTLLSAIELTFVKLWGYWGLATRFILTHIQSLWLNHHYVPVKVKAHFDRNALISLAKMSLRFSVPGYLHSSALVASMNTIILYYCGEGGLGVYTFSTTILAMALVFSNSLSQFVHVRISMQYGATEDVYKCLRYAVKPAVLGIGISLVLAAGLCISIEPFIRILLPKYVESIFVIRILSIALIVKAASLPLLVINSALLYRTFAIKCVLNISVALLAIVVLPKTPSMAAVATILGLGAELLTGYCSLAWNYNRIGITC